MSLQIKIIIITALISVLSGSGFYLKHIISKNTEYKLKIEQLDKDIKKKEKEYEILNQNYSSIMKLKNSYQKKYFKLNEEYNNLSDKFNKTNANGSKRDFGNLALKKPALIENIVNKATNDVFRCFEVASGSQVNDEDKTNKACPSIINFNK